MRGTRRARGRAGWLGLLAAGTLAAASPDAAAQAPEGPPSPVGFTRVERRPVRESVRLPGTVESRRVSEVASEVEGVVTARLVGEGDRVRRGDPLVVLRTTNLELELESLLGQLKEAEARLELATRSLERARDLLASDVIAQERYDDAVSNFNAWSGRRDDLTARIRRVRVDLERCSIVAPFDGSVVGERVEVGEWIDVGDAVMEIASHDDLEVRVDVPERFYPDVSPGDPATVRIDVVPGLEVSGEIRAVIRQADESARTFPARIRIPEPDRRIGAGMLASVSLATGATRQALIVPKDAVVSRGGRRFVYRIEEDGSVRPVDVLPGTGIASWVAVQGDLAAGDRVVTRGNERLRPGQVVRGEPVSYDLP